MNTSKLSFSNSLDCQFFLNNKICNLNIAKLRKIIKQNDSKIESLKNQNQEYKRQISLLLLKSNKYEKLLNLNCAKNDKNSVIEFLTKKKN